MHCRTVALPLFCLFALSGCAIPLVAGFTVVELGTAGSLVSTAATGKGLGEHAMDAATGRDCRVVEAMVRDDREVCELENSPATEKDWKGLARLEDEPSTTSPDLDPGSEPRNAEGG